MSADLVRGGVGSSGVLWSRGTPTVYNLRRYLGALVTVRNTYTSSNAMRTDFELTVVGGGPLSIGGFDAARQSRFAKLGDRTSYVFDTTISGVSSNIRRFKRHGLVSAYRALYINKFTVHGYKERSLKFYAKALNRVHQLYNVSASIVNILAGLDLSNAYYGAYSNVLIGTKLYQTRRLLDVDAQLLHKRCESLQLELCWEDTSAVFDMMRKYAPDVGLVVTRVSKVIYKNTRGKSGRYVGNLRVLRDSVKFQYMQRYIKQGWRFSQLTCFSDKMFESLYKTVVAPELSLGVLYGDPTGVGCGMLQ